MGLFGSGFNLFLGIVVLLVAFKVAKALRSVDKTYEKRVRIIEESLGTIGGRNIRVQLMKRRDCPYAVEFESDEGAVYVFYLVNYLEGEIGKQVWAIAKIDEQPFSMEGSKTEWFWREATDGPAV